MPEVTEHAPGFFCWAELSTTDTAAAKQFYATLFGWESHDIPIGPDQFYTMLKKNGKDVGALYRTGEDQEGTPPNWLSYVAVNHADDTATKARSLGATVTAGPFDVFDAGRMAVLRDPTGAVFGLWQPNKHIGAQLMGEPGSLCWNELMSTNETASRDFYRRLFGWKSETGPMQSPPALTTGLVDYTFFKNGGRSVGGMLKTTSSGMLSHWLVYFAVDDCDRTVESAKRLGGKITVPASDIPNIGRFSILQDPQGAFFAVIRLS